MLDKVLPLFKIGSGCDYHRIVLPLTFYNYDFSKIKQFTKEELMEYKVLFFNRQPITTTPQTIKTLKEKGFKIVMDLDDYWVLGTDHYLHKHWKEADTTGKIIEFMKIADKITCTTARLAAKIKTYNEDITIIPNSIPFSDEQFQFNRSESTHVRFGFVGGPSHTGDLRSIAPVFQHYNHLRFTMYGFNEKHYESIRMRDICSNNQKNPNYQSVPNVPLGSYMFSYNDLDVCIAPLEDKEFNKYKSNLKILEAGAKKCAMICSPNVCYTDTVPDTVVTYCKSIKDWKNAISLHQDMDYVRERGEKLYIWVKNNYNMADINPTRIDLLCDIQQETQRQEDLSQTHAI